MIEFTHLSKSNFGKDALGGRDFKQLDWTIEIEPFSTFSYSVMRNNILSLCIDDNHSLKRDAILYLKAPSIPSLKEYEDI